MIRGYSEQITSTFDVTTVIPLDDTTPLVTEGEEIASFSYTPDDAASTIRVIATVPVDFSTNNNAIGAIFDGSTCIGSNAVGGATGENQTLTIVGEVTFASLAAKTISVRIGPSLAGTIYVNKDNTGSTGLGNIEATLIEVQEYLP